MYDKTQSTCFHMPKDIHTKLKLMSVSNHISLGSMLSLIVTEAVKDDFKILKEMLARNNVGLPTG